jgi:multidrug efflux pump subunit AcrA (membrane-fusion protein)
MKRIYIISGIVVVASVLALIVFSRLTSAKKQADLYTAVIKGDFEIALTTAGELKAENSVDIKGPDIAPRGEMRSMDIRIQDLVPEGTEVKEGDYIAQLDRSDFENTLKDVLDRLDQLQVALDMKLIDTSVTLSAYRNDIQNQRYIVQEDSMTLVNSKYEPPATIREAEINFYQAKYTMGNRLRRYTLNVAYAKFQVDVQRVIIGRITRRKNDYEDVLKSFTIKAPSPGMVIYRKDWRGNKRKTGSMINSFDRVVATLPDLSSMMSRIYISEIDINKIKPGQKANIVIDAFPKKSFNGIVSSIANIGDKLPNSDSKVFEVLIKINGTDPSLRPTMTTGNKVIISTFKDVTYVPLECVHAEVDSVPYVFTKNGTKQVVMLGKSNEKYIIIEKGLEPGTKVYLSVPENAEKFKLAGEELIPVIKKRDKARRAENEKYVTKTEPVKIADPMKEEKPSDNKSSVGTNR